MTSFMDDDLYHADWLMNKWRLEHKVDPQLFLNEICSSKFMAFRYPKIHRRPPSLRVDLKRKSSEMLVEERELVLASSGQTDLTICHELGHLIVPYDGHGPKWRDVYVDLTTRFCGAKEGRVLKYLMAAASEVIDG